LIGDWPSSCHPMFRLFFQACSDDLVTNSNLVFAREDPREVVWIFRVREISMSIKVTVTSAAIGIAALSLVTPAVAGNGSAVGAGLAGFGIGAIVGSALAPQPVYVAPPPPVYYAPPPPVVVYAPPPRPVVVYGPSYRYGYGHRRH
jgi:hypothetical protein